MADRMVVLLCGPAGAGKTTAAHQSGLTVYDRDDPQWPDERTFRVALATLGADPRARAVVIRSGASSTARTKAAQLIQATHCYLLTAPADELGHRVARRGRADARTGLASIRTWFEQYDRADGVQDFPGWGNVGPPNCTPLPIRGPSRPVPTTSGSTTDRGYGWTHQQERARWQKRLDHGETVTCRSLHCRCGHRPVDPRNWHLGHTDDRTAWTGPEAPGCNLAAAADASRASQARGRPSRAW